MDIASKRLESQHYFEELLGCDDPKNLIYFQDNADTIQLNRTQADRLQQCCEQDATNFLFKGVMSLLSGVSEIEKGRQTWPVVQLYYANYYFLRSELLMRNRCIFRANRVFTVLCQNQQKIEKVNNKKSKNDHDLTIFFAQKYLIGVDVLLSQTVNGDIPYIWMQNKRNWYQYKKSIYIEHNDDGPFFSFDHISLEDQINMFINDTDPYYCFDADYATLALPIKRFQLTARNATARGLTFDRRARKALDNFRTQGSSCIRLLQLLG